GWTMHFEASSRAWLLAAVALVLAAPALGNPAKGIPVDFDRDVRPVLSENCFACHGFDSGKRQAGLRLDLAEGALKALPSGHRAILPGKPDQSELVRRV